MIFRVFLIGAVLLGLTACVQTSSRGSDLETYINSSAYSQYKVAELRKVTPADLKTCKDNATPNERVVIVQQPVQFKTIPNPLIFTSHVYGNPVRGKWIEKQIAFSCGKTIGITLHAEAIEGALPRLNYKISRNVNPETFMSGK